MFNFFDFEQHAGRQAAPRGSTCTKLYDELGVPKTATASDIKKKYRAKAMAHHPDKGGDPDTFKRIAHAYEILSDPAKRERYDMYGEDGVDGGGAAGHSMHDIFSMFGEFGRPSAARTTRSPPPDISLDVTISIVEACTQDTKAVRYKRRVRCTACKGCGGTGPRRTCTACNGTGCVFTTRQLMPGMIQQLQSPCTDCRGQGTRSTHTCTVCAQKGVVDKEETLTVATKTAHMAMVRHRNVGHQSLELGVPSGHVVVTVRHQDKHGVFERKGDHLTVHHRLPLADAICGFKKTFVHPAGETIVVHTDALALPGSRVCVPRKGVRGRGDLYAVVEAVEPMPTLTPAQKTAMRATLAS